MRRPCAPARAAAMTTWPSGSHVRAGERDGEPRPVAAGRGRPISNATYTPERLSPLAAERRRGAAGGPSRPRCCACRCLQDRPRLLEAAYDATTGSAAPAAALAAAGRRRGACLCRRREADQRRRLRLPHVRTVRPAQHRHDLPDDLPEEHAQRAVRRRAPGWPLRGPARAALRVGCRPGSARQVHADATGSRSGTSSRRSIGGCRTRRPGSTMPPATPERVPPGWQNDERLAAGARAALGPLCRHGRAQPARQRRRRRRSTTARWCWPRSATPSTPPMPPAPMCTCRASACAPC